MYDVSRALTPKEKHLAHFWASMVGEWSVIASGFVSHAPSLTERQQARVFAALLVAQYDATIAVGDAKYAYWSIRPVTAIRRDIDPTWSPLIVTPMWPSYVSAHAGISAAGAEVFAHLFPSHASYVLEQARLAAQ